MPRHVPFSAALRFAHSRKIGYPGSTMVRGQTLTVATLIFSIACGRLDFVSNNQRGDASIDGAKDAPIQFCAAAVTPHDEDGDGFDDACDVCPNVIDAAQSDADDDKVGDACDPAPTLAKQRVWFFDPFIAEPSSRWNSTAQVGWQFDEMNFDRNSTISRSQVDENIDVYVEGTVTNLGLPRRQFYAGSLATDTSTLWYGELIDDGPGQQNLNLLRSKSMMYVQYATQDLSNPFALGTFRYHLGLRVGTPSRVDAVFGNQVFNLEAMASDYAKSSNRLVLYGQGSDVKIRSIYAVVTDL
jgi:hypothetical protein